LVILLILDGITTYFGVVVGDGIERNPIMLYLMNLFGPTTALAITTVMSILYVVILLKIADKLEVDSPISSDLITIGILPMLFILYALVILNNFHVLVLLNQ